MSGHDVVLVFAAVGMGSTGALVIVALGDLAGRALRLYGRWRERRAQGRAWEQFVRAQKAAEL